MTEKRLYKPKEVVNVVDGLNSTDLLRRWCKEFNIITEWTQLNNEGQRRFTKGNVEEIKAIAEKLTLHNWSWDQVRAWRNGEEPDFKNHEEQSIVDKLLQEVKELREENEMQRQFNKVLVQKLDEMPRLIAEEVERRGQQKQLESGERKQSFVQRLLPFLKKE